MGVLIRVSCTSVSLLQCCRTDLVNGSRFDETSSPPPLSSSATCHSHTEGVSTGSMSLESIEGGREKLEKDLGT